MEKYLAEVYEAPPQHLIIPGRSEDLAWWHQRMAKYSEIYDQVLFYLAVRGAEANEERHLSQASLILTDLRKSMRDDTLDDLLVLKFNKDLWENFVLGDYAR